MTSIFVLLICLVIVTAVPICREDKQVYLYPAFGSITFIDFDQQLRAELAQQYRKSRTDSQLIPPPMKKSIALGRARLRPGKRADEVPYLLETGQQPLVMVSAWFLMSFLALGSTAPVPKKGEPVECKVPIPNAAFGQNKTLEQVLGDVAKVMNLAQKSGLRYGKRSGFDARTNEIAYAALYPRTYVVSDAFEMEKRQILPKIPGFYPSPQMVRFVAFMLSREKSKSQPVALHNFNPRHHSRRTNVEQFFHLLELKERTQQNSQLRAIKQHYQTSSFTRARPGKRSSEVQLPKDLGRASPVFPESVDHKKNTQEVEEGSARFRQELH